MTLHVFTTGRGTPYGLAAAPVIKVSTRSDLTARWHDLIDLDAGTIATGKASIEEVGWELFRDGCPGGESPAEVEARADRVVARLRAIDGDAVVFASGHLLRAVAVRWLGLPVAAGRLLALGTATLSQLGYDHGRDEPCLRLWNDAGHLGG